MNKTKAAANAELAELKKTHHFECGCAKTKFVPLNAISPNDGTLLNLATRALEQHEQGRRHQTWEEKDGNAALWQLLKATGETTPAPQLPAAPAVVNSKIKHFASEQLAWEFVLRQIATLDQKKKKRDFELRVFNSYLTSLNLPAASTNVIPEEWLRSSYLRRFLERDNQCRIVKTATEATHIIDKVFVAVPSSLRREHLYKVFTFDIDEDGRLPYEVVERAPRGVNTVVYAHVNVTKVDSTLEVEVVNAWRHALSSFSRVHLDVDVSSANDGVQKRRLRLHTQFPVSWGQLNTKIIPYFIYLLDSRLTLGSGGWTQRVNVSEIAINFSYNKGLRLALAEAEPPNPAAVFNELIKSSLLCKDTTKVSRWYKSPELDLLCMQGRKAKPYTFRRGVDVWADTKKADWLIKRNPQDPVIALVRRAIQSIERWRYARVAFIRRFKKGGDCVEVFMEGVGASCSVVGCSGLIVLQCHNKILEREDDEDLNLPPEYKLRIKVVCMDNNGASHHDGDDDDLLTNEQRAFRKIGIGGNKGPPEDLIELLVGRDCPLPAPYNPRYRNNTGRCEGALQVSYETPPKAVCPRCNTNHLSKDTKILITLLTKLSACVHLPTVDSIIVQTAKHRPQPRVESCEDEDDDDDDFGDDEDIVQEEEEEVKEGEEANATEIKADVTKIKADVTVTKADVYEPNDDDKSKEMTLEDLMWCQKNPLQHELKQIKRKTPQRQQEVERPPKRQKQRVQLDDKAVLSMWHHERKRLNRPDIGEVDDDYADDDADVKHADVARDVPYPHTIDEFKTLCTVEFNKFLGLPIRSWAAYDKIKDNGGGVYKDVVTGVFMKAVNA